MSAHWVDIAAVTFFVVEWLAYGFTLEHTAYGRDSLSARMHHYREVWVRNILDRAHVPVQQEHLHKFPGAVGIAVGLAGRHPERLMSRCERPRLTGLRQCCRAGEVVPHSVELRWRSL